MKRLTTVILNCMLSLTVWASGNILTERYNLSYINLENGLPHNNVSSLFTDSNGFLWIATYGGGLVRYDGYGMMTPMLGLKSLSCKSIAEDRFKRLWVTFDEGTNVIDLRTMLPVMPNSDKDNLASLLSQAGVKAYCDTYGRIWLITTSHVNLISFGDDGSVKHIASYRYRGNTPEVCISDVEGNGKPWVGVDYGIFRMVEKDGNLVKEEISPLLQPLHGLYITDLLKRGNSILLTTNHGLFRYEPYLQRLEQAPVQSLSHEFLSSMALMPDNTLLVGSLCGVNIYDDYSGTFSAWTQASNPPLKNDFVHCLLVNDGLIYVGTEAGGIIRLVPRQLLLQNSIHTQDPSSLSPNPVNAMYAAPDGTLWVGTVEGGLNRRVKGERAFIHYTKSNSALPHNSVSTLAADGYGRLWVGTWGGGLCWIDMKNPQTVVKLELPAEQARLTNYVGAMAYDAINDGMWIGSNDGLFFYRFKTKQLIEPFEECQLVRGSIGSIITRDGHLWMGCMQGVVIVDLKSEKNGRFKTRNIRHLLSDPSSKIYDKISSFCEASDGTLWLGSNGYGLYKRVVDKDGKEHFDVLTQEDGLVYNGVKGIVEDRNGRLWITTQNGLSVYDPKLQAFTNYSQHDGLISPHFYWNSAIKDASGNICLGSEAGLIEMLDDNTDTHYHGHLTFTRLMVDNQEALAGSGYLTEDISVAKTICLKEGHRSFSIDFSALDYGYEMQGVYSYRMKGFDNDWVVLKPGEHSVRYSALPAGNYTFEVNYKSVQTAVEGTTISIEVVVKPYFWRSWWFRMLLSILFIVFLIYLYNRWAAIVKRREAEQLLTPIRRVLEESDDPRQLQSRIQNILDNQERYKQSVTKSVEADKEEVMKSTRPFMERVMEIMETHYMDSEFGVQEFCDALGMSRSVASKHLNAEAGLPVGQFIRNYRLNMAKEMLSSKTGNRNITEIAFAVGFNDPKYFTRCFTKMYGVNPSSWS
ncbi:MAG: helix-turn-helix domain-containing protein [Prevotella ruminicola]|uniref:Helix-turn-helix domain-containing protein n=1 Tax=Xylanibacter ruminicola TaxID=839 RepID=A0A9D5NYP7_XYLRU|nr:helix-turn-helix domain-containing protein [Xylanibacter ruminicola]